MAQFWRSVSESGGGSSGGAGGFTNNAEEVFGGITCDDSTLLRSLLTKIELFTGGIRCRLVVLVMVPERQNAAKANGIRLFDDRPSIVAAPSTTKDAKLR